MKRTQTLVLVSLALVAAASVTACKKPADNTADNTAAATAPDTNTPPPATNDTNSMGATNATGDTNAPTNSPS